MVTHVLIASYLPLCGGQERVLFQTIRIMRELLECSRTLVRVYSNK